MVNSKIRKYNFFRDKYGRELLVDFGRIESLKNYDISDRPHFLTYYDITFICEGKGKFRLDENEFKVSQGKIIFSSPGQIRQWLVKEPIRGYVLLFESEFVHRFFNDARFVQKFGFFDSPNLKTDIEVSIEDFRKIETFLFQIEDEITAYREHSEDMLRAVLYQVLVFLNRLFIDYHSIPKIRQDCMHSGRFVNLVEDDFLMSDRISYYADKMNLSANHLNFIVKKQLGCSAKKYIINRIILEAKRLLIYTDQTVTEICYSLSFNDPSYFARYFKKHTGLSPLSYREIHL